MPEPMSPGELAKRVAVAAVGIPLALLLIFLGGWPLTVFLAVISGLAAREFYGLGAAREIRALEKLGILGAVGLVLLAGAHLSFSGAAPWGMALLVTLLLSAAAGAIWVRWPGGNPMLAVPLTLAGALYTGGTLSFAVYLRHLPDFSEPLARGGAFQGPLLLVLPLAVTWASDSAAYFFGHAFGNRKLIPSVSPGKTVVGGMAGLLTAIFTGALIAGVFLQLSPNPWLSLGLGAGMGLLLGVTAQMGDLVESVLKREAGVKDSSDLLPGHGGILDRFDATFFTLPVAYGLLRLIEVLS